MFAGVVAPQDPYNLAEITILDGSLPPGSEGFDGFRFHLGSDVQGRDMLSAMIYGLRISLFVSFVAVSVAVGIGLTLGMLSAWRGGWAEAVIMRIVDIQLSFPALLVALLLLAALGKGVDKVILALVLVQWAYFARTVRGAALVEIRKDYIMAARSAALPGGEALEPGARDVTEQCPCLLDLRGAEYALGGAGSERIPGAVAAVIRGLLGGLDLAGAVIAPRTNWAGDRVRCHVDAPPGLEGRLIRAAVPVSMTGRGPVEHLGVVQGAGRLAGGRVEAAADPAWAGVALAR